MPSIAGVLYFSAMFISMRRQPKATGRTQTDPLTGVILGVGQTIGIFFRVFAWFGQWMFAGLAAVSLLGVVISFCLWMLQEGLADEAAWARPVAFIASIPLLLVGLTLALTRAPSRIRLIGLLLILCGFALLSQIVVVT